MSAPASIVARVNGIALNDAGEAVDAATLRQRACTELVRQAARAASDELASSGDAIERWLERTVSVDAPDEEACRRHFAAYRARYDADERLELRHVLFAVTPGVDVNALRARAEEKLLELRCASPEGDAFAAAARTLSNCPSGAAGGALGWVTRDSCAPEFARDVFGQAGVGVLPRLVHSRFGFHIVEILARDAPRALRYDEVAGRVRADLARQAWVNAVRDALRTLAAQATLEGVSLDA
jgi:peptidyl-prolyl cis-trans isomerase C